MPIPKLRFKEFKSEWRSIPLSSIVDHVGGTALESYVVKDGEYKFISIGNYSENGKYIDNGQRIEAKGKAKDKILNQNDLVMVLNDKTSSGKIIGSTILVSESNKYIYNQRSERIICRDEVFPYFMWLYLNSPIFKNKILHLVQGGTQIYINFQSIYKLLINLPIFPEQEKIADFLTTYDRMIDVQAQRVESMKTRKKGLLQKIFSQEIRFKDDQGQDYPEWEKVTLGNVMDNFSYGMNAAAKEYDGINKYLRITDIDEQSHKYRLDSYVSPNAKLQDKYILQCGDICFARTGASVGKTYIYDKNDGKVYYAGFLIKGHVKTLYNAYFIYLNTLTDRYAKWVQIMSARTGQPGINMEEYKTYKIHCPSLPEQQKIADFLTAVDAQIEVEEKRLETMKAIKKGLLQQMFI